VVKLALKERAKGKKDKQKPPLKKVAKQGAAQTKKAYSKPKAAAKKTPVKAKTAAGKLRERTL
jgi:hypothetical protein